MSFNYIWIPLHGEQAVWSMLLVLVVVILFLVLLFKTIKAMLQKHKIAKKEVVSQNKVADEQELHEQLIQSDLAISSAGMVLINYDINEETIRLHKRGCLFFDGIRRDEMISFIDPAEAERLNDIIEKFITKKISKVNFHLQVNIPEDESRWFEITATVLSCDEHGRPKALTGLCKDITDQLAATAELSRLREAAEEASRLKSAFLANMSHEIRTPLNAIVGFSKLIAQTEDAADRQEYVHVIEANNKMLLDLVNDVLDLSKIEAGQMDFKNAEVDVWELMSNLQQMFAIRCHEGVGVHFDQIEERYFTYSDNSRITQVISNFLANAVKYTSKGEIHIGCIKTDIGLRFYVSDTGIGIDPKNQHRLFERFEQLDSSVTGTGLGLSICKMIIQKMNGTIGVSSDNLNGSTFWFEIPCQVYLQQEHNALEVSGFFFDDNRSDYTILIAEDHPENYLLLEKLLIGYNLLHAWNGVEAIELYQEIKPNLILMDLKMPVLDGYEATAIIRKDGSEVPIIAVSSSLLECGKESITILGFNDFISNPINEDELYAKIRCYLH